MKTNLIILMNIVVFGAFLAVASLADLNGQILDLGIQNSKRIHYSILMFGLFLTLLSLHFQPKKCLIPSLILFFYISCILI